MTPSQFRQTAANKPSTVNSILANWIQQASEMLKDAANQIEKLEKQLQEKVDK